MLNFNQPTTAVPAVDASQQNVKMVAHRQMTIQTRHFWWIQGVLAVVVFSLYLVGVTRMVDKIEPVLPKSNAAAAQVATTTPSTALASSDSGK